MQVRATTFIGAEIRYAPVDGDALTYVIEVDVYTKLSAWDFSEITIDFGDGSSGTAQRTSIQDFTERDIRLSTYQIDHTYPSAGSYIVRFDGYNRIAGIANIPSSISQSACIRALIVVDPILGPNHSIRFDTLLTNTRRDWNTLVHTPAPNEVDGDSIVFELVPPWGLGCSDITGYYLPPASNFLWLNPENGELLWDYPTVIGPWTLNIQGSEYRNGQLIGQVTRDMNITVLPFAVGSEEIEQQTPFALYPSLTDDLVTLLNRTNTTLALDVRTVHGALVGTYRAGPEKSSISLGHLAPGLYIVQARGHDGTVLHSSRLMRQ